MLRRPLCLLAYSTSCVLLQGLLTQHYVATCSASWFSIFVSTGSPWCSLVRKGLHILQWSPLAVTGMAGTIPAMRDAIHAF